jgi:hypothetical protein
LLDQTPIPTVTIVATKATPSAAHDDPSGMSRARMAPDPGGGFPPATTATARPTTAGNTPAVAPVSVAIPITNTACTPSRPSNDPRARLAMLTSSLTPIVGIDQAHAADNVNHPL